MDKGYAITMADYRAALEAQGIDDADVGDVVLVRTGWNSLWKDYNAPPAERAANNAEHGSGEPGLSPEVCDHLADRKIAMVGSDTWALGGHGPQHPDRFRRLLPHEPDRPARHYQFRKSRPGRSVRGEGPTSSCSPGRRSSSSAPRVRRVIRSRPGKIRTLHHSEPARSSRLRFIMNHKRRHGIERVSL